MKIKVFFPQVKNTQILFKSQIQKNMLKTQARPAFKLNYFECKKGSYHDGQVLNYVCIQKNCDSKGLICSVCKNDHNGHHVIPLKYLLNTLKNHQEKPMESQSFQEDLQQLQQLKNQFLYSLKTVVQKFAQKIQFIEEQIIQQFKRKKVQLLNQIELNMKFNQIIEQTLQNKVKDQQNFEKDFRTIASLIQSSNANLENAKNVGNLSFSINLKNIVKNYQDSYDSFSKKLNQFLFDSQQVLYAILENRKEMVDQVKLQTQVPMLPSQIPLLKAQHRYSPTLKGTNMNISNQNKTAQCLNTSSQRFALIDGIVQKKGSTIRFKVQKLKNWVGLGIALKNNIVGKNYHFLYNNVGHGSFLVSNNGYSWSHAYAANNLQTTTFGFVEGNIVKLQVTQTELIYTNQSQQNKVYKLPIMLNQNEWKQVCFCVNLCSAGDTTTIL